MNAKIIFISILMLIALSAYMFNRNQSLTTLNCSAKYYLFLNSDADGVDIKGEVILVFRIYSKTKGVASELGMLNVNGKIYSINRAVNLNFIGKDTDGYMSTQRISVIKNENDDLPDAITDLLMSKQTLFFYKIMPVTSNIYGIRDLRRTIMVCRAE